MRSMLHIQCMDVPICCYPRLFMCQLCAHELRHSPVHLHSTPWSFSCFWFLAITPFALPSHCWLLFIRNEWIYNTILTQSEYCPNAIAPFSLDKTHQFAILFVWLPSESYMNTVLQNANEHLVERGITPLLLVPRTHPSQQTVLYIFRVLHSCTLFWFIFRLLCHP